MARKLRARGRVHPLQILEPGYDNELFDHEFLREKFGERWVMLIHLFIESMEKQLNNLESSISNSDKRKSLLTPTNSRV